MGKKKAVIVTEAFQGTGAAMIETSSVGLRKIGTGIDNDDERKPDTRGDQPTASGNRADAGPCDDRRNVRVGLF